MKYKKKLTYKEEQKKLKVQKRVKWAFAIGGWCLLGVAFFGLIGLQVKSCSMKKNKELGTQNRIIGDFNPIDNYDGKMIFIDDLNGTLVDDNQDYSLFEDDLQINTYNRGDLYNHTYMTWAQYKWDWNVARHTQYNSWFSTNLPECEIAQPRVELHFINYNNASNHYIGLYAPLCELKYTMMTFNSIGTTTITKTSYDLHEMSKVWLDDESLNFTHIRNNNYNRKFYFAMFTQNGYYDSVSGNSYTIMSMEINFYRLCSGDILNGAYTDGYDNSGYPLCFLYGLDENDGNLFYHLKNYMTFNKMFFNFDETTIETGTYQVAIKRYLMNNGQKYVDQNSYCYSSTNPTIQTYTLGEPPTIVDGGSSGGTTTSDSLTDAFGLIAMAFGSIASFFNIQIIPGITFGTLFAVPIIMILVLFVVWLFKR